MSNLQTSSIDSIPLPPVLPQIRRPAKFRESSAGEVKKKTTNVVVSDESEFHQTIIIPPAIDTLLGMTVEERVVEVRRACERDEVAALRAYVIPLTNWMTDLDFILANYGEVVEALEEHFNKPGRPEAGRATWGDLEFTPEMMKHLDEKFQYKSDTPISWAGICHVFFNRSIRTMQRRKAFQLMLTSGEAEIPRRKKRPKPSTSNDKPLDQVELEDIASRAIEWASENPDNNIAQAIMKIAADRANRLAQNVPSFEVTSGPGIHLVQPSPTKDSNAELRMSLENEPDLDVANKMLTDHLRAYAEEQFANDRIRINELKVTVEFAGRNHRIMPGDFLEKRGQNVAPMLSKCVGVADHTERRRVQEWADGRWGKEHVVFNGDESDYRVITEQTARRLAPEAFPKPPTPVGL